MILLFALKEEDNESIGFHRTLATLSKKYTKYKCKIWKIAIFYDDGCYFSSMVFADNFAILSNNNNKYYNKI